MKPLTARQEAFCAEYLVDLNGTQAAIRAGYSARGADVQAARLLGDVRVASRVRELMAERSKRTEVTADAVLQELWSIATADANELIEHRRGCCRYCWGKKNRYQETPAERERRRADWARALQSEGYGDGPEDKPMPPFDEQGGLGWDPRRNPNPKCPECLGRGIGDVVVHDTTQVSEAARRLYAGVKVTRDGLEVLTHDKLGALVQVGRHLGMFVDRKQVSGAGGGPIETVTRIERVIVRPHAEDPNS